MEKKLFGYEHSSTYLLLCSAEQKKKEMYTALEQCESK